jgi:uncharacterized iron-regulated membrane protein
MVDWRGWLKNPEKSDARNAFFQIHYWMGMGASMYVFIMSISGSVIVYRNELSKRFAVEWLVNLHENLLFGTTGRALNGVGAICLTLVCLTGAVIWWPGIKHWRRSLAVNWKARFPRITWDLHSALGFWCFVLILIWGFSGIYFSFPHLFDFLFILDPADHFTDQGLSLLSELHFGRFGWFSEAVWSSLGLAPAVLAFTGVFICCRRVIFKKPTNPNTAS